MNSSFTGLDAEAITKNCNIYAKRHPKAKEVLKRANGVENYKQIAAKLKLHPTLVSSLLKQAASLGLATKNKGLYKKTTGILGYMPKGNLKEERSESIPTLIEKTKKRASNLGVSKQNNAEVKMAKAYTWLYLTENILRDLIRTTFQNEQDWWKIRVNPDLQKRVAEAKVDYPYDGATRKDELEYTHLGQLKEIITSNKNWTVIVNSLNEKDKNSFIATVDKAIPSRNSIAHCTPLTGKDLKVVEIRFEDILKMIK